MKFHFLKVVVVYIAVFVSSPRLHPLTHVIPTSKDQCSREGSSIVRHFIQTLWKPIFKKFEVKVPEECPLHFTHDVFKDQELAKLHYRANLWVCGVCGKSFYREPYLDMHVASAHPLIATVYDGTNVCYADYCDVFRCRGYMSILSQRKAKNYRGSLTRILGSKEALYDLGINVHDEEEFNFFEQDDKKQQPQNALMTMPPPNVLRALDDKNDEKFIVGMTDSDDKFNVQDPYHFASSGSKPVERGFSRPRSGVLRSKTSSNSKQESFRDEVDDILLKTVKLIESKLGRKLEIFNNSEDNSEAENDGQHTCDPQSMKATRDKCIGLIHACISPLLIDLADTEYLEMEGLLIRQLCEYLTCERHREFAGIPNAPRVPLKRRLEAYILMFVLAAILALILFVIYYVMWLCFWQLELKASELPAAASGKPRPTHLPMLDRRWQCQPHHQPKAQAFMPRPIIQDQQ